MRGDHKILLKLARAMATNTNVTELLLSQSQFGVTSGQVEALVDSLQLNSTLKVLHMDCCRLNSLQLVYLANGIGSNHTLTDVSCITRGPYVSHREGQKELPGPVQEAFAVAVEANGSISKLALHWPADGIFKDIISQRLEKNATTTVTTALKEAPSVKGHAVGLGANYEVAVHMEAQRSFAREDFA